VDQVIGDSIARIVSSLSDDEIEQYSRQLVHLPARYPSLRLPPHLADALGQAALQFPAPPSESESQEVFLALCDQVFGPREAAEVRALLYGLMSEAQSEQEMKLLAVAARSLEVARPRQNPLLMALVRQWIESAPEQVAEAAFDVSVADQLPVPDELVAAVGAERARRLARTPIIFRVVNRAMALIPPDDMARAADDYARILGNVTGSVPESELARVRRQTGQLAARIITDAHRVGLRQEIARARSALVRLDPERSQAMVAVLDDALASLQEVPDEVNPLVQYWFVGSFERYLAEL